MLAGMAAKFDDDDGAIAAKMAQLQGALATRDAVVAGEDRNVEGMHDAGVGGGGGGIDGPSPNALIEIQSKIRTVETDLAATEQALTAPENEEARKLLAATMPVWGAAVMPGALDEVSAAAEVVAVPAPEANWDSAAASVTSAAASVTSARREPEPEPEPAGDGEAVAGVANGYGTVAVDLAAEARNVAAMKAKGLNPDGSTCIHLPGMNEAPPTAMKRNPVTGEMEEFHSSALQDDLPEEEEESAQIDVPIGDDY